MLLAIHLYAQEVVLLEVLVGQSDLLEALGSAFLLVELAAFFVLLALVVAFVLVALAEAAVDPAGEGMHVTVCLLATLLRSLQQLECYGELLHLSSPIHYHNIQFNSIFFKSCEKMLNSGKNLKSSI